MKGRKRSRSRTLTSFSFPSKSINLALGSVSCIFLSRVERSKLTSSLFSSTASFLYQLSSLSLPLPNNNSPLAKAINTRSLNILRPGNDIKLPSSDLLSSSASRRSEVLVSGAFFEEVVGICLRENASSETET